MSRQDERPSSRFWAFWGSLGGILTGAAALVAAIATLAALFVGGDDGEPPAPTPAAATQGADAGAEADGCLARYFDGIPADRLDPVEAGTTNFDTIEAGQTKRGPIGLTFTDGGREIGATRFAYFDANRVFKFESVVDAQCRPLAGYDDRVNPDSGTVRIELAGGFYDLTTIAWGSAIRVNFVAVVP